MSTTDVRNYLFNNSMYEIMETDEVHELLKDHDYLSKYINSHYDTIVVSATDNKENKETFSWNTTTTLLLLEEYIKLKNHFRDPKIKKLNLWREIAGVFEEHGYFVNEAILDRKLRNMKHHYKTLVDKNKKGGTRRVKIHWEYFNHFQEIYREDKTIHSSIVLSSSDTSHPTSSSSHRRSTCGRDRPSSRTPSPSARTPGPSSGASDTLSSTPKPTVCVNCPSTHNPGSSSSTHELTCDSEPFSIPLEVKLLTSPILKAKRKRTRTPSNQNMREAEENDEPEFLEEMMEMYSFGKKIIQLEEEKIEELKKIRVVAEEQLAIQRERNELFKQFLLK